MSDPLWVVCAARFELPSSLAVPVLPVGIGLLPAMSNLAHRLELGEAPQAILLTGTAGILNTKEPSPPLPFGPFLCRHFIYPRYRFEEIPEVIPAARDTGGLAFLDAEVAPEVRVYSTFGVTHDATVMEFHSSDGMLLENLEALGLAELCYQRHIPFYALLAVTNEVGPLGRAQWRQHHRAAGELLAFKLRELLAGL